MIMVREETQFWCHGDEDGDDMGNDAAEEDIEHRANNYNTSYAFWSLYDQKSVKP